MESPATPFAPEALDALIGRNGSTPKTVVTEDGALPLAIPRDRAGTFVPQLVPKGGLRQMLTGHGFTRVFDTGSPWRARA